MPRRGQYSPAVDKDNHAAFRNSTPATTRSFHLDNRNIDRRNDANTAVLCHWRTERPDLARSA
jgi:hypothetical protein